MNRRTFIKGLLALPIAKAVADVTPWPLVTVPEFKVYRDPIERFLDAVAQRETGNNPLAIGQHGERSAYQIKQKVWREYTSVTFTSATFCPDIARDVAVRHALFLVSHVVLSNDGWTGSTVYKVALAWHYGLDGARTRGSNDEYALAVERLFLS